MEIEELILKHQLIERVAVIGLPDKRLGEVICACIVLREGACLD
jgi:HIP---CoA ligase